MTVPNVGMLADAALLSEMAVRAEAAGWDGWFVWDHLLYHHEDWPVVDPWVAVSAAAARTERIRLGVMVAALSRYRPWRLAKTAVTLDRMSGGRLQFAVGLGSIPAEYSSFGEPDTAPARADRLDEALSILSSHRGAAAPFDVVMEGESPAARDHAAGIVAPYAALGVTWWLEKLGWWRGTVDQVIDRIDAGPPTSADRH